MKNFEWGCAVTPKGNSKFIIQNSIKNKRPTGSPFDTGRAPFDV